MLHNTKQRCQEGSLHQNLLLKLSLRFTENTVFQDTSLNVYLSLKFKQIFVFLQYGVYQYAQVYFPRGILLTGEMHFPIYSMGMQCVYHRCSAASLLILNRSTFTTFFGGEGASLKKGDRDLHWEYCVYPFIVSFGFQFEEESYPKQARASSCNSESHFTSQLSGLTVPCFQVVCR